MQHFYRPLHTMDSPKSMDTDPSNDAWPSIRSTKFTELKNLAHVPEWPQSPNTPSQSPSGLAETAPEPHRSQPRPKVAWWPAPFRTPARRNFPSRRSRPELLAKPPSLGGSVENAAERRRRRKPGRLGLGPRERSRAHSGIGPLTLQSLRTNIMPWPGYMGPEQK